MKDRIKNFHLSLLLNPATISQKRKTIAIVIFYIVLLSAAITIIGQIPAFSSRGITKFFQLGWGLVIIPIILLDYKHFSRSLLYVLILAIPFLIYLLIALACGNKAFNYVGTKYFFLSLYLFLIGIFIGKYFNTNIIKTIATSYIVGAFIYASVVIFTRLLGNSIGSEIYSFDDKNSAGPIFFIAALLSFLVFNKRNVFNYICKITLFVFFSLVIILAKCRATIIYIPIALIIIHIFLPFNKKERTTSMIVFGSVLCLSAILILVVPQLRETVIFKILLNNKKSIKEAFSGRIEQIINHFSKFKPALGSGNSYFDCMPLSFLVTFGIIGFISLLPILVIPFYSIVGSVKPMKNKLFSTISILIAGLMLFNSIFEGYGFVGPGTKVFMFWIIGGFSLYTVLELNTKKSLGQKVDILPKKVTISLNKKLFLIIAETFIITISGLIISSTQLVNSVGTNIVNGFDKGSKNNIINVEKIDIHNDTANLLKTNGLCLGQKIKLKSTVEPENCNNYYISWESGWQHPECISINGSTNVLTAVKTTVPSTTIVQAFISGHTNSKYIEFRIFAINDYSFKNAMIDVKPFDESFNKSDINEINLEANQSSKVYYDTNYIPNGVPFQFVSSDPSIATIDETTGLIKAVKQGSCKVYGSITNSKGTFTTNEITINVKDRTSEFKPVTKMEFNLPEKIYQHQPFVLNPVFNEDASDKTFDITLNNNTKYEFNNNELTIDNSGNNHITITSRSNPSIKYESTFNVISNFATKFTCENNWLVLGEIKNSEQLGLYLNYENGYKRIVKDSDLSYRKRGTINNLTASSEKPGFINNTMTEISATCTGTFTTTYTNASDSLVSTKISFRVSTMTKDTYEAAVKIVGFSLFILILLVLSSSLLFFNVNNMASIVFALVYAILDITMIFVFYSVNIYTICFVSFLVLTIFIFTAIRILFLDELGVLTEEESFNKVKNR